MAVTWSDFITKSARSVAMDTGTVSPPAKNRRLEQMEVDSVNGAIGRIRDRERIWNEYVDLANGVFGGNFQLAADATGGGLRPVYPELWLADAALAKHVAGLTLEGAKRVARSRLLRQMRHSPTWKAKRVLSRIPAEESKIRYGDGYIEDIIPVKPGTSRVYRGSGDNASKDLSRTGVLETSSGYDKNARGLYGYQGWKGSFDDYWGMFPDDVKKKILEQMQGKMLVTGSPNHAFGFTRGGNGNYIHVYDIPKREYDALKWTGDAGQQRGVLEYAKRSLEESGRLGKIPSPFGNNSAKGGLESAIDRNTLAEGYAGSVHPMYSFSRLKDRRIPIERMFKRGLRDENRLGRIAGFRRDRNAGQYFPKYDMKTYFKNPSDVKTYSPVEETMERIRNLERSGYGNTWMDRLIEIISPTVQR